MKKKFFTWKTRVGVSPRLLTIGLAVLLLASMLAACSSSEQLSNYEAANAGSAAGDDVSFANQDSLSVAVTSGEANQASDGEAGDAAAQSDSQASGMGEIAADGSGLNRKLIYRADVNMEVKSYADAQTRIRQLANLSGGYILNFEENESIHNRSGTFTLKVPSQGFSSFLEDLERMEPISIHRSVEGTDVTSEYVDLEARLKAKRVVETRLLAFMEQANNSQDLLAFSNELSAVQEEIERILGRKRYLDQNVAYSTITLHVHERLDGKSQMMGDNAPLYERAYHAMGKSLRLLRSTLDGLVVVIAALLPVLLFLGLVALPAMAVYRRYRKSRRQRGSAPLSSGAGYDRPRPADDTGAAGQENGQQLAGSPAPQVGDGADETEPLDANAGDAADTPDASVPDARVTAEGGDDAPEPKDGRGGTDAPGLNERKESGGGTDAPEPNERREGEDGTDVPDPKKRDGGKAEI